MVATLLSLKWRLTIADLKRSVARLVIFIILGVYALGVVVMALVGLAVTSMVVEGNESITGAITIIVGATLVLGWMILPLLFFGTDQTLDPARFVQFPLTGRQLAPGLVLSGILGLPGMVTAILSLGMALPWLRTPWVLLVGLVGGGLGFLMTQVFCRLASTALSGTLSSRKVKDLTALIGLVVILVLSMAGYAVSMVVGILSESTGGFSSVVSGTERLAAGLAWTPLGAPWALVADAAQGRWLVALGHLGLTVVYLLVGLWLYSAVLSKALVTPVRDGSSTIAKHDSIARAGGWTWAQGNLLPVAAITARCLRYWRRDPRYLGQIPAVILVFALFSVMGVTMPLLPTGDTPMPGFLVTGLLGFGLGLTALMTGYVLSADIASDATAWWIHLATGIKGWQDRLGRVLAQAVWAVPLLLVAGIVVPSIVGGTARIPAILGAIFALYLCGIGVASIFSALIIYPVPLPGESPMRMKTGMMGSQMLSQLGSMTAGGLLGAPIGIWAIFASGVQTWLVLIVGLIWGGAVAVTGIIQGGRLMESRAPTILQTLIKNDSRERS
ncbi:MAG: hypothetical protein LBE83_00360 [Propionibacteriaceae bacterium]|jgi:ABC-2 type transport system permease protein|nr:hypothetical protein [Propionibacteriaceae bacterium]